MSQVAPAAAELAQQQGLRFIGPFDRELVAGVATYALELFRAVQDLATVYVPIGCGSGILSIAAIKRWPAAHCIAIDNDPIAVAATLENAAHNSVNIGAAITPLGEIVGVFPLVLANIQAHVLRALKDELIAKLAPGGTLILSGLLTPQAQPLADEYVAAGLRLIHVRPSTTDAQWSCAVLAR